MNLTHLEYFCTVAAIGNISEAARRHYISQPAMSKYMSALEKELKVPLFIRNGNQIALSSEGKTFYAYAKSVVTDYQDALTALREGKERITINLQVNTTRRIMLKFLKTFLPSHPEIDLLVDFSYNHEALESNDPSNMYHFSVGSKSHNPYLNRSAFLFTERMMLAVSKNHPLADRKSVSVKELRNEQFVLQALEKYYSGNLVACCRKAGFEPKTRLVCHDKQYIFDMVSAGIGIGVMPEFSWGSVGEDICLVAIEELGQHLLHHNLYWNDNRYHTQAMVDFRESLVAFYHQAVKDEV